MERIQCRLSVPCGNMGKRPLNVSNHSFEGASYNTHSSCKQQRSRVKTVSGVSADSEKPKKRGCVHPNDGITKAPWVQIALTSTSVRTPACVQVLRIIRGAIDAW